MAKFFKGFKQLSSTQFNEAKANNDLNGYLWFVRTTVTVEGEETNDLTNDSYDIYFGSKQYGHFSEGEIKALQDALDLVREDLGFAAGTFTFGEGVTTIKGAFDSIATMLGALTDATETNAESIKSNADAISALQEGLAEMLVKDVDANDKVLTVADGILSSQISLTYENNRIALVGKDNEEIAGFDASAFIKDSVLEDVEVTTKEDGEKYIVFTWKTEGEETKTDEIKVSDFAKLYNAGTALELAEDGVTFNVKVAQNENFLSVNANNELIVDDITTDKTKLKEAITIEGGPLATDAVKAAFPNGVIPADSDIQAVLKALLCVEIYPVPTKNTPSYSVSITTPSLTASVATGSLVEVGTKVTVDSVTAKSVTVSKTEPKVSGFEHGYSDSIDGDVNTDTSISGAWTVSQKDGNVYELSATVSGFTGTAPATVQNAVASSCILSEVELTANLGTNTYKVTEDAPVHTGSHNGVASYYIVSNLGGRSEDKKSVAIEATTTNVEKDPDNKTATYTLTGVYPVYTNMKSGANNTTTVENRLALSSGKTFTIEFGPEADAFHAFAFPATHTLSSVEIYNTMSKEYETYSGGSETEDATYSVQNVDTDYKVWKRLGNAYTEKTTFRFTLNKNLNTK